MREFVILKCRPDILALCEDKPVTIYIDKKPYILCSEEYFERQKHELQAESEIE